VPVSTTSSVMSFESAEAVKTALILWFVLIWILLVITVSVTQGLLCHRDCCVSRVVASMTREFQVILDLKDMHVVLPLPGIHFHALMSDLHWLFFKWILVVHYLPGWNVWATWDK
jgi:hypothetical protein